MNLTSKTANTLFVVLIIVVISFVIFVTYYMINFKEAFTENPFVYGAKKLDLGQCSCSCFDENTPQPISFYFNQTYFEQKLQGG